MMSRLMSQDDANIRGFIHGGSLIKLMEEAGFVAATRQIAFANAAGGTANKPAGRMLGALARIEQLDFLLPVEVGDVVEIKGGVDFASAHSCRVSLELSAAHTVQLDKKERGMRLTNRAKFWYVPKILDENGTIWLTEMPKVDLSSIEDDQRVLARTDYLELKEKREKRARENYELMANRSASADSEVDLLLSKTRSRDAKPGTVSWTKSAHSVLVDHNDCDVAGNLSGGALMKMADEVAALAASKHSLGGTPTTVAMDAVNFNKTIPKGSFVHLESHISFAGGKSCEVFVQGDAVNIYAHGGPVAIPRAMEARFTFVTFGADGKLKTMPSLTPETEREKLLYQQGKERHERRKRQRS